MFGNSDLHIVFSTTELSAHPPYGISEKRFPHSAISRYKDENLRSLVYSLGFQDRSFQIRV